MSARFNDGKTARTSPAQVAFVNGSLHITADGLDLIWPVAGMTVAVEADEVRVSHTKDPDARLTLSKAEWDGLGAPDVRTLGRSRRRETILISSLAAVAACTAAFVFWGVPALSGPLARATPVSFEQRMGQNLDGQIGLLFGTCASPEGQMALSYFGDRLEEQAETPFDIRVRAVNAPLINAFALPGGTILVTDDLIREVQSPDELAAVIAHEVAHIEKRHVMQAVWRNLGIGMVLDLVVGGGTGAGQQAVILAGQASQLSYSRAAEVEADGRGQALLHGLGLSSRGMAIFFERLAAYEGKPADSETSATEFMSTHPDTARRIKSARAGEKGGASAFAAGEWAAIKSACE